MAHINKIKYTALLFFFMCSMSCFALKEPLFPSEIFKPLIKNRENTRHIAILLDCTLGFFGVHRMYLGTDPKVPVFYTLSMGGGGLLWLVDLGILIAHKDIEPYMNNPRMFMWAKKEESLPAVGQ